LNVLTVLSFDAEHTDRLINTFHNGTLHLTPTGTGAVLKTIGCVSLVFEIVLLILSIVHSLSYSILQRRKRKEEFEEETV
jgi:hypothetical protein